MPDARTDEISGQPRTERARSEWRLRFPRGESAGKLASALGISSFVAHLLVARGIEDEITAERLLNPKLGHLHDPFLMLGMRQAVKRVLEAIERRERIFIYGDYDVDGTTGTTLLRRFLQLLGATTGFHIPHRFTEGYGIRQEVLERARDEGYTLVITVDCGIRAHGPAVWARDHNLDLIITDHHLPEPVRGVPQALAVLNPNQPECNYPDKALAGVGVAFKLLQACLHESSREGLIRSFLKIVALGTVADMAPLVGENRIFVSLGLEDLPGATNKGLVALLKLAGFRRDRRLRAADVAFRLGPRINAAGRMDNARAVVELFEAKDEAEADRLAAHLEVRNEERRELQGAIFKRAFEDLGDFAADTVAVIAGENWHRGVIGLAASRMAERLNRPCVIISLDEDGFGHGSGRSIKPYHLLEGLTSCADLFENFGGHRQAAGLLIRREKVSDLRRRLNEHARPLIGDLIKLPGVIDVDMELPPAEISLKLAEDMARLEPHGMGWERPVLFSRGLRVVGQPRVINHRNMKLHFFDGQKHVHEAIWWGGAENCTAALNGGESIESIYSIDKNSWEGCERVELDIRDLKLM